MTKTVDELMRLMENCCECYSYYLRAPKSRKPAALREMEEADAALRSALEEVVAEAQRALPKDPPAGLLMSMAIRYDHGLGCPGYYDGFPAAWPAGTRVTHAQRLENTLRTMRQLYEEVSGHGFYTPAAEAQYAAMQQAPEQEG